MSEDLVVGVDEVIVLWAAAEGGKRGKEKAKEDSLPGSGPVRNDKVSGAGAVRNDKTMGMTSKELGEMAEAEFLVRVLRERVAVAKPWGDSRRYDFIVDTDGKLCRVQVKSAFREGKQRGYSLRAHGHSLESYTAKEIDVLAGWVEPEDVWYLFPVRVVRRLRSLKLFPGSRRKKSKFEKWREAWWVLRK